MAKEIERKFLVADDSFMAMAEGCVHIVQGYLSRRPEATVRVRIKGDRAFLTVKTANCGAVRDEWEYDVPVCDAEAMLAAVAGEGVIDKTRWFVRWDEHLWEVDQFHGRLAPLVVAEVELSDEKEPVTLPPFVGREVTGDVRYYNSNLVAGA